MGQRISYFKNNHGKSLQELILDHSAAFRQWYLDNDESSLQGFNEPFGNENLKNYLQQNTDFKTDFPKLNQKTVDELTVEFLDYAQTLGNDALEFFGPNMSRWRYDESTRLVLQTKDETFIKLWKYLIEGRSLKDNAAFDSYTNDYKIGFLTFAECQSIKEKIQTHFGDIQNARKKWWDNSEEMEGLKYALHALDAMKGQESELITGIEHGTI